MAWSVYLTNPSSSPNVISRAWRSQAKSVRMVSVESKGSVSSYCSWSGAKPVSIMTARATDSPPLSARASAYRSVVRAVRIARSLRAVARCSTASINCSRVRPSFEIAESAMGMPSAKPVCSRQSVAVWMGGVTDMPALCIAPAGSIWCRWIRTAGRADGLVALQTCTTFRCRHETSSPRRQAAENEQNVQSGWMIARARIISQ